MEQRENNVIWKPKAEKSVQSIYNYIYEESPVNAEKFINKLINFGNNLGYLPCIYPICRHKQLAKRKMHCAVFKKNYIFVYKVIKNTLYIYNVIHAMTNPVHFS